jgi:hypothetical protein
MTINDMHNAFRTIGQQMGMQTIRAILPEEIDIFLNASIVNKVRSIVQENASIVYNDKVTQQRNDVAGLNALLPLLDTKELTLTTSTTLGDYRISLSGLTWLFLTSAGIKHTDATTSVISRYGCRVMSYDDIYMVNQDYCNKASNEHPIAVFDKTYVYIYSGGTYPAGTKVVSLEYVKNPAKVINNTTPCDLPDHLHYEIVSNAVAMYFQSVGSTSQNPN